MNLAQLIDPEWVQDRMPRRVRERKEADPALVAKVRAAEVEGNAKLDADLARESATERRLIEQQVEREAVASRVRATVEAPLRVPTPPPVVVQSWRQK